MKEQRKGARVPDELPIESEFLPIAALFKGHVDGLVTVATGALVVSVTFLKDSSSKAPHYIHLLKFSWILFALSIVSGIVYNYTLARLAKARRCWGKEKCNHKRILNSASQVLHLSFFAAVICFLIFALWNV
jgi:hypothetical protein